MSYFLSYGLYILELENNKYYVGMSHNVEHRIQQHLAGNGSRWTKLHKPTGKHKIIRTGDNPYNLLDVDETTITYHLMVKLGYENVRGAGWTARNLPKLPKPPSNYKPL